MNTQQTIIIKLGMIILFLLCLLPMPYGYFQAVRLLGCGGFAYLAYKENDGGNKNMLILWVVSAILINPFIKVSLGRTLWNVVDVIWAVILIGTLLKKKD